MPSVSIPAPLLFPTSSESSMSSQAESASPSATSFLPVSPSPSPSQALVGSSPAPISIHSLEVCLPSLASIPPPPPITHSMIRRSQTKKQQAQPQSQCLTAVTIPSASTEPNTYQEALSVPAWSHAMTEEYQAFQTQHTWCLVPLPLGKRAIGCKWVFKVK